MKTLPRLKNLSLSLAIGSIGLIALSGCTSPSINKDIDDQTSATQYKREAIQTELDTTGPIRGGKEFADRQAKQQQAPKSFKRANKSWIGSDMVAVNQDDKLPPMFSREYSMNFADGNRPIDLSVVADRLSNMVGIPVRVRPDAFTPSSMGEPGSTSPAGVRPLPPVRTGADAAVTGSTGSPASPSGVGISNRQPMTAQSILMNWNGTLTNFLNHLTDKLDLSWEYRDNTIIIMRFTSEMYELATFPNGFTYSMSSGTGEGNSGGGGNAGGGGGAGGGARGGGSGGGSSGSARLNSTMNVAEQGKVDSNKAILDIIKQMVSKVPGSEVLVADGSGRVMVNTTREMQSRVRDFVRSENANLLKQVHIQLDVYSVTNRQDDQKGVDWNVFYQSLSRRYNLNLTSPTTLVGPDAGAVSFTIPAACPPGVINVACGQGDINRRFEGSNPIVNALYQIGDNVQHRPISLIAMNRQWARKARLTTTGYLSETTPGTTGALGGGSAVPGLTTDSITTGDQFAAMPFVLENNTVMVKMNINLSELLGLFEVTAGQGATLQRVQTPNTSAISDQYTVALKPGEVMAITGLSREVSGRNERRLAEGAPLLAGGSKALNTQRENFIVFVRAVIL